MFVSPVKTWRGLTSVRPGRSRRVGVGLSRYFDFAQGHRGGAAALRRGSGQGGWPIWVGLRPSFDFAALRFAPFRFAQDERWGAALRPFDSAQDARYGGGSGCAEGAAQDARRGLRRVCLGETDKLGGASHPFALSGVERSRRVGVGLGRSFGFAQGQRGVLAHLGWFTTFLRLRSGRTGGCFAQALRRGSGCSGGGASLFVSPVKTLWGLTSVRPERSGTESKGWGWVCAVLRLCFGSTGAGGALRLRSGQALRLRSGQALRLRSGQALRLRSGQALRLRSGQALRLRSGQALRLRSGQALRLRSGQALRLRSGQALRLRSGQALRLRSGQALRLRSGQALRLRSGQALRLRSGQALRLRSGQALRLRRTGPSTPLRTGPSTPLRTGPSTPLRTGPSTPLRTGPSTPCGRLRLCFGSTGGPFDAAQDRPFDSAQDRLSIRSP